MPTLDQRKNFAKGIVSTGYDAAATTIVLATNEGSKFPSFAGNPYNVVWWNSTDFADPADDPTAEIVRVTARTGDSLTVTRGQESTSASTHQASGKVYKMALCVSRKMIDDIEAVTTGLTKCAFMAKATSAQSLPTTYTQIEFYETYDDGACFDNDQHRFVAPKVGYYFFSACFEAANEIGKVMTGVLMRNETIINASTSTPLASIALHTIHLFSMTYLDAGDFVSVRSTHNNVANISLEYNDSRCIFTGFCVYNGS
jgi:hypothetical protein